MVSHSDYGLGVVTDHFEQRVQVSSSAKHGDPIPIGAVLNLERVPW